MIWPDWWQGTRDFAARLTETRLSYEFACQICKGQIGTGSEFYAYLDYEGMFTVHSECVKKTQPCIVCNGNGYVRTTPMTPAELITGFGRLSDLLGDTRNVGQCKACHGKGVIPK